MATATFAAGCFWGVEKAFRQLDGVTATAVGYTGGTTQDPSYEQVCSGRTGHAEAVQVDYDAARVSYNALLDVFWSAHDATSRTNRRMRSAIFVHDQAQLVLFVPSSSYWSGTFSPATCASFLARSRQRH